MADIVIGFGGGKKKDLRDWAPSKDEPAAAAKEEPPEVDLGERRLMHLAEKAGAEDPAAFIKAVKAIVESCKDDGPPEAEGDDEDDETE